MMATELVPSTIPDADKPPSSDLIQNNVDCMFCSSLSIISEFRSWDEFMG